MRQDIKDIAYIEEDEIDLKELFATIWRYKFKIATFVSIMTFLTIIYTLGKPNVYSSNVIVKSKAGGGSASLGGLGGLAALAGVSIGKGASDLGVVERMNILLENDQFLFYLENKYSLMDRLDGNIENYVFAAGISSIYNLFHSDNNNSHEHFSEEDIKYNTKKELNLIIDISEDKKTSLITISVSHNDRFLAKELVDIFVKEMSEYLRVEDMKDISKEISYYKRELAQSDDIELKKQLSGLVSSLIQKRVLSNSSDYYLLKILNNSQVPFIQEKTKPKRGLIVIVSFITSIILGIFFAFFIEFLRGKEE